MRTLGDFSIERAGQPVKFSRKAPKRLLDLLRLIIVLGGRHADLGGVAATLWPQAQGDEAREALKAMLRRTRALLGADILVVRDARRPPVDGRPDPVRVRGPRHHRTAREVHAAAASDDQPACGSGESTLARSQRVAMS